jgi:hypothetical protein
MKHRPENISVMMIPKIKEFILEKFELWKNGNLSENTQNIEQFSRKNLTKKLAEIL